LAARSNLSLQILCPYLQYLRTRSELYPARQEPPEAIGKQMAVSPASFSRTKEHSGLLTPSFLDLHSSTGQQPV
jgi:hypothetical protein